MQISENLPQFEETPTLIIVAAKQSADLYLAHDGHLEDLDSIEIDNPQYSDREGHFKRRSKGETLGSGAVYEENKELVKKDFYNALNDSLKNITSTHNYHEVVLLSPPQNANETKDKLPKEIQNIISLEVNGNYTGQHATKVLEAIQKQREEV